MTTKLTYERLHEILRYEPDTGDFFWTRPKQGRMLDKPAGSFDAKGYRQIFIDRANYLAHRLAWLYVHGYFPETDIDHIDRNPSNNRLKNLREVSRACNLRNQKTNKNNTSGVSGVYFYKCINKWNAKISDHCRHINLGYTEDFAEAVCLRLAAEQCLDWQGCSSTSDAYIWVKTHIQGNDNGKTKEENSQGKGRRELGPEKRLGAPAQQRP